MATGDSTFKIKVNFRTGEFEAEGPTDVVNERFKEFKEAFASVPVRIAPPNAALPPSPDQKANTPTETFYIPTELDHIFSKTRDGKGILLRMMPDGEGGYWKVANAALLVMYAHQTLLGNHEISAVAVGEALRASGANTINLFRPMGLLKVDHLITSQGAKRSTKYKITLKGTTLAKKILDGLLEKVGAARVESAVKEFE